MGWTPNDYYNASLREYLLAQEGYHERKELDQYYLRRVAYIVHCSMVENPLNPVQLWPIGDEKEQEQEEAETRKERLFRRTAEEVEKMNREMENVKVIAKE